MQLVIKPTNPMAILADKAVYGLQALFGNPATFYIVSEGFFDKSDNPQGSVYATGILNNLPWDFESGATPTLVFTPDFNGGGEIVSTLAGSYNTYDANYLNMVQVQANGTLTIKVIGTIISAELFFTAVAPDTTPKFSSNGFVIAEAASLASSFVWS
jgi:hypothetical protein